jgi:hypothetical protein
MGIADTLLSAGKSVGGGALQGAKDMVGANQKAYIEIADFSKTTITAAKAQKPAAGNGALNMAAKSGFSLETLNKFAGSLNKIAGQDVQGFDQYKGFKKYRFECQFNPEEISISGYGGEELPIQNYGRAPDNKDGKIEHKRRGSIMDSAKTRIDLNFKLVFDKTNIQDAFYADKFTLSPTNIGKGAGTAVAKALGKKYSVQPEVEALTAIVRNNNRRLARFVWGDMIYEGVINTINAEYVMFNVNGEPCRAFVNIGMILYDEDVAGANTSIWKDKYMDEVYSVKSNAIAKAAEGAADLAPDNAGFDEYGLNNFFGEPL